MLGEVIPNTASIYCDFNLPVRTNPAQTTIVADPQSGLLPLRLISFNGNYKNNEAMLQWTIAGESGNERVRFTKKR